jgi:hypothetical protein
MLRASRGCSPAHRLAYPAEFEAATRQYLLERLGLNL